MDTSKMPVMPSGLGPLIRYEAGHIIAWGLDSPTPCLLGDGKLVEQTLALFDSVLEIQANGDGSGAKLVKLRDFHIRPGGSITLCVRTSTGGTGVRLTPEWMRKMRPALEAAAKHAAEKPNETQVFIPDEQRGWRYGSLCDE